jgi:hypothetical protein
VSAIAAPAPSPAQTLIAQRNAGRHPEEANAIFDNLPAVGQALAESAGDEHAARDKLLAQLRGTASIGQQAHRVARTAQIRRAWKQGARPHPRACSALVRGEGRGVSN